MRIVKQYWSGFIDWSLFMFCLLKKYQDENNHDHLLAKSYGCKGGLGYMQLFSIYM